MIKNLENIQNTKVEREIASRQSKLDTLLRNIVHLSGETPNKEHIEILNYRTPIDFLNEQLELIIINNKTKPADQKVSLHKDTIAILKRYIFIFQKSLDDIIFQRETEIDEFLKLKGITDKVIDEEYEKTLEAISFYDLITAKNRPMYEKQKVLLKDDIYVNFNKQNFEKFYFNTKHIADTFYSKWLLIRYDEFTKKITEDLENSRFYEENNINNEIKKLHDELSNYKKEYNDYENNICSLINKYSSMYYAESNILEHFYLNYDQKSLLNQKMSFNAFTKQFLKLKTNLLAIELNNTNLLDKEIKKISQKLNAGFKGLNFNYWKKVNETKKKYNDQIKKNNKIIKDKKILISNINKKIKESRKEQAK